MPVLRDFDPGLQNVFTLENGLIENNTALKHGGGISLSGNAALAMSGGTIRGNVTTTESGGGVNQFGTSMFTMTNGVIENNRVVDVTFNGGGVHLAGIGPTFQFKGGIIRTNQARSFGGGVATFQATVVMSGGTLNGNTASNGGGVSVDGDASKKGLLTLTAGSITGNTASVNGGGVFTSVNGTFANSGGSVTTNTPNDIFAAQ